MSDVQRVLIGSVQMGKTKGGKVTAELYSTDKRLEFPVLTLFDLSMLETVGIDPNGLNSEPVHKRFWAYYTESDKTTSRGNPYRDCQYLEPVDTPATTTSTDTSAIVTELRAIRTLLEILLTRLNIDLPEVNLGDTDGNADWIGDPETRAQEQAIHDQLAANAAAGGNGNGSDDEPVPRNSKELVAWINLRAQGPQCDGVGHLMYCIKKELGQGWGWPNSEDQAGWDEAAAAWYEYWKDLQ